MAAGDAAVKKGGRRHVREVFVAAGDAAVEEARRSLWRVGRGCGHAGRDHRGGRRGIVRCGRGHRNRLGNRTLGHRSRRRRQRRRGQVRDERLARDRFWRDGCRVLWRSTRLRLAWWRWGASRGRARRDRGRFVAAASRRGCSAGGHAARGRRCAHGRHRGRRTCRLWRSAWRRGRCRSGRGTAHAAAPRHVAGRDARVEQSGRVLRRRVLRRRIRGGLWRGRALGLGRSWMCKCHAEHEAGQREAEQERKQTHTRGGAVTHSEAHIVPGRRPR